MDAHLKVALLLIVRIHHLDSQSFSNSDPSIIGYFDAERIKQGQGKYVWMKKGDDDSLSPKATYEGNYKDGKRNGFGKMEYPNGDIYEGEWSDNKVNFIWLLIS